MKTIVRLFALLGSFALASAVHAASWDFSTAVGSLQIDTYGYSDAYIEVIDTDTNTLVADFHLYSDFSGGFYGSGYTYVSGVTLSVGATTYLYNLTSGGNYRVVTHCAPNFSYSGATGSASTAGLFDEDPYTFDTMWFYLGFS